MTRLPLRRPLCARQSFLRICWQWSQDGERLQRRLPGPLGAPPSTNENSPFIVPPSESMLAMPVHLVLDSWSCRFNVRGCTKYVWMGCLLSSGALVDADWRCIHLQSAAGLARLRTGPLELRSAAGRRGQPVPTSLPKFQNLFLQPFLPFTHPFWDGGGSRRQRGWGQVDCTMLMLRKAAAPAIHWGNGRMGMGMDAGMGKEEITEWDGEHEREREG